MHQTALWRASCLGERAFPVSGALLGPLRHYVDLTCTQTQQLHTSPSPQHPGPSVATEAMQQEQPVTVPPQDGTLARPPQRMRGIWQDLAGISISNRRLVTKGEMAQKAAQHRRQQRWHGEHGSHQQPTHEYLTGMLSQHTHSLPGIIGQAIQARVLMLKGDRVYVDAGFHSISELYRPELTINHVVQPSPSAPLSARKGTSDVRVGDMVAVKVEEMYTPYGDMQLQPLQQDPGLQLRARWAALKEQHVLGKPVQGRVLNQCRGGYAVGVAGFVGLLPYHRTASSTCQSIGTLQPFYIEHMDDVRQRMVLVDAKVASKGLRRKAAATQSAA